jgi:hypothetical protein
MRDVVGNGQIERLIKVAQPFSGTQQYCRCQAREDQQNESDPGAEE